MATRHKHPQPAAAAAALGCSSSCSSSGSGVLVQQLAWWVVVCGAQMLAAAGRAGQPRLSPIRGCWQQLVSLQGSMFALLHSSCMAGLCCAYVRSGIWCNQF